MNDENIDITEEIIDYYNMDNDANLDGDFLREEFNKLSLPCAECHKLNRIEYDESNFILAIIKETGEEIPMEETTLDFECEHCSILNFVNIRTEESFDIYRGE
jgi:hypothetical protein